MKRREAVQALLTPDMAGAAQPDADGAQPRTASGAVRAMGMEITRLTEEARAAEALRERIEQGTTVVALDPHFIDPSFVADRFTRTDDADYHRLVESIRDTGQQVPILVRPHPAEPGRYQVAYGHRRREAAAELGIAVKAIVRPLRDDELVVAQGQENGERRNLSFIERALFAVVLQRRGFDRATLNGALGVHTAEMTRLLAVAAAIPEEIIRRIGPAPKAGRHRWHELARHCDRAEGLAMLTSLLDQPSIQALPTDRRFDAIIATFRQPSGVTASSQAAVEVTTLTHRDGTPIVRLENTPQGLRIMVDEHAAPGLSAFVAREMSLLIARFQAGHR